MSAETINAAFRLICETEEDIEDARVLAKGIVILGADALHDDQDLGAVFIRLGRLIGEHCENIAKNRGELFKLLHPSRAEFEEKGWPGC